MGAASKGVARPTPLLAVQICPAIGAEGEIGRQEQPAFCLAMTMGNAEIGKDFGRGLAQFMAGDAREGRRVGEQLGVENVGAGLIGRKGDVQAIGSIIHPALQPMGTGQTEHAGAETYTLHLPFYMYAPSRHGYTLAATAAFFSSALASSQSHQASMPSPLVLEIWRVSMCGLTSRASATAAS